MAHPPYLVAGNPKVESFDLQLGPAPDSASRSDHPFAPWGPITKFYVRFSIRPVRQFCFHAPRHPEHHALPTVHLGLVLARAYGGNANHCIWRGQILDAVLRVAGITPKIADMIARIVHDRIVAVPRMTLAAQVHVEMDAVTPYFVQGHRFVNMVSEPVQSHPWPRGQCGACSGPLVREMLAWRTKCSHFFHFECLFGLLHGSSRACPICQLELRPIQDDDVNRARMQRQRKRFQEYCNCDPTHIVVHKLMKPDHHGCNGDRFLEQCNVFVPGDGASSSSNDRLPSLPQSATNKRCRS